MVCRIFVTIIGMASKLTNLITAQSRTDAYEMALKWVDEIGIKTDFEFKKVIIEIND